MDMQALEAQLRLDLTAERILTPQVVRYIADQYSAPEEQLASFFSDKYPTLEDYEVDLTFSYLFTPNQSDRERYMSLLGSDALSREQVTALEQGLAQAGLQACFTSPLQETFQVPLNEVSIERYVGLLKLDLPIHRSLYQKIQTLFPEHAPMLSACGRSEAWQAERWAGVLEAFLTAWQAQGDFSAEKACFLCEFVKSHRPADFDALEPLLDNLIVSCKNDMDHTRGRGMVSQQLRDAYEESDLKRLEDLRVFEKYDQMSKWGEELKADIAHIRAHQGEFLASLQQPA